MADLKPDKVTIIGWLLTIIISISGTYLAMNSRVYALESSKEVMEARVDAVERTQNVHDRKLDLILQNTNTLVVDVAVLKESKADRYKR